MILSRQEVGAVLTQLTGTERLVVMLLYGAGLRLESVSSFASKISISIAIRSLYDKGRVAKTG